MSGKPRRPEVVGWKRPERIADYPTGPSDDAGFLVTGHAGWRVFRPVVDAAACVGCQRCWLLCPDGAVARAYESGKMRASIDYEFCKGCGVCARECKVRAISMEKETT